MAVGFILEFSGVGSDKYDAAMKELGLVQGSDANWPDGIISHVAGTNDAGAVVVDVWESEAHFGRFQESRLGPALAKVGGMPQPTVTTFQVVNKFPK
jgi:hypothetical protein